VDDRAHWNASRYDPASSAGFYESWFQRANHPTESRAFWILYTVFVPERRPERAVGELWAVTFDRAAGAIEAAEVVVPVADYSRDHRHPRRPRSARDRPPHSPLNQAEAFPLWRRLIGVIGSRLIGDDPWSRTSWSGSSYFLFSELRRQEMLHRAFGVEVPPVERRTIMLSSFHPDPRVWRQRFYADPAYRARLTEEVGKVIAPDDLDHDFLQLGALFDVPSLVAGKARVFSYHDGNLARALESPHLRGVLGAREIEAGLAYERRVYSGLDRIMTTSDDLRRSFIEDYDVPEQRAVTVRAGINLEQIPDPVDDRAWDARQILFVGVDFLRKGGPQLLRAFKAIRERYPRALLHVVGPRSLEVPTDQRAGVRYHGYLSKSDPAQRGKLQALFRDSCLFVLPSLFEPFGIAVLEAMAHQIPAVVTNRWALREIVTPGVNGDHVECGSVDSLVEVLSRLLADPERLRQMGDDGRRTVLEGFTWESVVGRMRKAIAAT
jgi:starch synthase